VQFAARGFLKPAEILGKTVSVPGLPFAWGEKDVRRENERGPGYE